MALLKWTKKYSVGVDAIDKEHAAFLGGLNKLHSAMLLGQGKRVTGPLLQKLPVAARHHFATEESMMKDANYPGLAAHRDTHQQFARHLDELVALHEHGDRSLSILLLRFMRRWISDHVQTEDRAFAPWLKKHGIK